MYLVDDDVLLGLVTAENARKKNIFYVKNKYFSDRNVYLLSVVKQK